MFATGSEVRQVLCLETTLSKDVICSLERERDIFTPVFTRQEDVKPVKGFEQLQVQAASQSGKHSSVLAHFFK